jgi:hypothetical protein
MSKNNDRSFIILEENRIILIQNEVELPNKQVQNLLERSLIQEKQYHRHSRFKTVTTTSPSEQELRI